MDTTIKTLKKVTIEEIAPTICPFMEYALVSLAQHPSATNDRVIALFPSEREAKAYLSLFEPNYKAPIANYFEIRRVVNG